MTRSGPKVNPTHGPLSRHTLLLDETAVRQLRVIGGGNVSNGVRIAAREAFARYQATPDVIETDRAWDAVFDRSNVVADHAAGGARGEACTSAAPTTPGMTTETPDAPR